MAVIKAKMKARERLKQNVLITLNAQSHPGIKLKTPSKFALERLTAAALILPGLLQPSAHAAEDDTVDFQYSHYQEGRRSGTFADSRPGSAFAFKNVAVPNSRNPIEVDSLHGSSRITLTDRVKFAFNYTQDTWGGATPFGSAPERSQANHYNGAQLGADGTVTIAGASAYSVIPGTYLDRKGNILYQSLDPITGQVSYLPDRAVHVMSYASPETRKQGDFKLGYEWDEAALEVGGGISIERDYESRFVNLGGRMDFNQKQTTLNLGLSYTNSAIAALLDGNAYSFINKNAYQSQITTSTVNGGHTLHGTRQDWATHLGLTQVINKDALMELGMGYTRSTGFQENPYKLSWMFAVNANAPPVGPDGIVKASGQAFIEQRPDVRNQWNWTARWVQYVAPMNAALHLDYQFAHDDWGINAHTFTADWVQPLGSGWSVTPRVRYYSQDAASFYQPYFIVSATGPSNQRDLRALNVNLPSSFSSDQRLSGYGTLSGGITVSKNFAKGVSLETGFEYYTHQGNLKLGGGGEQAFANFDYWVANAALKVNLSALGHSGAGAGDDHDSHKAHGAIPAGVLFGHTLAKAGDMMAGYRFMRSMQGGGLLHGTHHTDEQQVTAQGCPGTPGLDVNGNPILDANGRVVLNGGCTGLPQQMTMNMHMLELMYAPADWLTLMLMPQFVDMQMVNTPSSLVDEHVLSHGHGAHGHESGGIGDTGLYALFNLFDTGRHHLHTGLGFSAPTGDVGIKLRDIPKDLDGAYIHYGMQLGSGTWDFKPSLTYTGKMDQWSWGAQATGTKRLQSRNASGYALGDLFESSLWGGYDLTHWLSASVRAAYTWQGSIKGRYPRSTRFDNQLFTCNAADFTSADLDSNGNPIGAPYLHQADYNQCVIDIENQKIANDAQDRPTPMDSPINYGGHYVDIGLGLSAVVPNGSFAGNRLSFEWLQPVYTYVNGYQLDRQGALSATWSYGF